MPLYASGINSLWSAGISSGAIIAPFNLFTTDLNTFASAGAVLSSVNGTSGAFTQTSSASAVWGYLIWVNGTAITLPVAPANVSGWFIRSHDGGTTYETSAQVPPRSPDFVIPFAAVTLTATSVFWSPLTLLWSSTTKVLLQNNTGVALTGTGQKVVCSPYAIVY